MCAGRVPSAGYVSVPALPVADLQTGIAVLSLESGAVLAAVRVPPVTHVRVVADELAACTSALCMGERPHRVPLECEIVRHGEAALLYFSHVQGRRLWTISFRTHALPAFPLCPL